MRVESGDAADAGGPRAGNATIESSVVTLHLFGGFELRVGGELISENAWRLRRSRDLIKVLALSPQHRLHRDVLLDRLWPTLDPQAAANNFYRALHFARKALANASFADDDLSRLLRYDHGELRLLGGDQCWIDLDQFRQLLRRADVSGDADLYRRAIELYRGELLLEDRYEDWASEARENARSQFVRACLQAVELYRRDGNLTAAENVLRQLLEQEPSHEDAHRELIRILASAGRRHEALIQYRHMEEALRLDLDVEPSKESQKLLDTLHGDKGLQTRASIDRMAQRQSTEPRTGNLPVSFTSFIGREIELNELCEQVLKQRLIVITGTGGSGKTRLALEVARRVESHFADGALFVELAGINDPSLVSRRILSSFSLTQPPARSIVDTLIVYLCDRRLLLVIDNCEHLLTGVAPVLERILQAAPGVHVLATSREPLHIPGEFVHSLQPFDVPDPVSIASVADALRSDAVRLFVERARASDPHLVLDEERARAIAHVCHSLAGLPLAIELAASRTRAISVERMLSQVRSALDLSLGSASRAEEHQRSVYDAIRWSYNLLSGPERKLFRRLAVFRGGWSLDAAVEICGPADLPAHITVHHLTALVEKSLVVYHRSAPDDRYRLLEPIRQFAVQLLLESDEASDVQRRHRDWCVDFARETESALTGPNQREWLDRIEQEHDNLRAALEWSLNDDPEPGLRLAGRLWMFWRMRGYLAEGAEWLGKLLTAVPHRDATHANALLGAGIVASVQGDWQVARAYIEECYHLCQTDAEVDPVQVGRALGALGHLAMYEDDLSKAKEYLRQAVSILEQSGDEFGRGWALDVLGDIARGEGRYHDARRIFGRRRDTHLVAGDQRSVAWALIKMGNMARLVGRYDDARAELNEGLELARSVGDRWAVGWALGNLAALAHAEGEASARELYESSLDALHDLSDTLALSYFGTLFGVYSLERGDYSRGVTVITAAGRVSHPTSLWLTPDELRQRDQELETARKVLGEAEFNLACLAGERSDLIELLSSNLAPPPVPRCAHEHPW